MSAAHPRRSFRRVSTSNGAVRGRAGTAPMLTSPAAYHGRVRAGTHIASTESVTDPEPRIAYESELEVDIVETPEFNGMRQKKSGRGHQQW